ncbi:MAG TPA: DNA polymerase III subunit alpha [Candidatus Avidehalobacter gallistercoris]|uniref:DNA polymerase III subunit alpha n=1 Tax=Candidatus Avidehalobacter gallistercoris TaxID=2840694 RepID=A0A9D1HK94_9FIRM|nr:DNA polymerase III subunit alpha [Candidatus Avidehalobacter gallistercoris]
MVEFVHLHNHSEYSLLDGAARIKDMVAKCAALNMPAVAVTDHGNMFGVLKLYEECKKVSKARAAEGLPGIKPVIGCEFYVAPRSRFLKEGKEDKSAYHLILLAENQQGYRNLCKLNAIAYLEGFYYKPRIDHEVLRAHSEGLICLSACLAGEVIQAMLEGDNDAAYAVAQEYLDIFGKDNYFIELQDHGLEEQRLTNPLLIKLAHDLGIGLVCTNDCHYIDREDSKWHDMLLCVQTGRLRSDPLRMRFPNSEFYLKSPEEMQQLFGEWPEAIANTVKIAERCHVNLDKHEKVDLPVVQVPEGYDLESYLRHLCEEGIKKRYPVVTAELRERLEYELNIIIHMRFPGYFLIVWDLVNFCHQNGIRVGPGRGSAAGSLVAYCLGITNIDPIRYSLIFERFLNPERVSMPDIDTDFCVVRRGEVIDYLVEKYGAENVGQIVTFGTMKSKLVVRDVGRALDLPIPEVNKIAKLIPNDLHMTLPEALSESAELKQMYDEDERIHELMDISMKLEGMPRHTGTHAAGVVIAPAPVTDYMPCFKIGENILTTQFEKEQVEEQGLVKMDILGLRTLTVIGDALDNIRQSQGIELDIDNIPLDDPEVYAMLSAGETDGVFQLESDGMRTYLKALHPERIEDIIAMVALYRPGPLKGGVVGDFIKRKHGETKVVYPHPMLKPVLEETYGVMIYQEQIMQVASTMAGFTLGQADELRRAMGKKKAEVLVAKRQDFLEGASRNGVDDQTANEVFDLMEFFSGYGFNKSHSAAYGIVTYQTAYLRCHYGAEYMAAILTSFMENADKVTTYIEACRKGGLEILPPDINLSYTNFSVSDGKIRFGLAAIKGVGREVINQIIAEREKGGAFTSLTDLCSRIVINKRILEGLIRSGALDSLGGKRSQYLAVYEQALDIGRRYAEEQASQQLSLFDFGVEQKQLLEVDLPQIAELSKMELLHMEKDSIGFYISGHPLDEYTEKLKPIINHHLSELPELSDRAALRVAGLVTGNQNRLTKNGDSMAIFTLEDKTASVRCVVFPKAYAVSRSAITDNAPVLVNGRLQVEDEERYTIIVDSVFALDGMDFLAVPKGMEAPKPKQEPESRYPRRRRESQPEPPRAVVYVRVPDSSHLADIRRLAADKAGSFDVVPYYSDIQRYQRGLGIQVDSDVIDLYKVQFGESNVVVRVAQK